MALPKRRRRNLHAMEKRRLAAAKLLNANWKRSEVANRFKVSVQTVSRWARKLAESGCETLRSAGCAGRKPRLSETGKERLKELLSKGPGQPDGGTSSWTLQRVAQLIKREFGIQYHPRHVWRVLLQLGWSYRRVPGRASECGDKPVKAGQKAWVPNRRKPQRKGRGVVS